MADNNFDTYKTVGSFNLGNQITLKNINSNVDRDYGPYEDKTLDEIADLLKDTIQIGKTIGVIEEGVIREYWWQLIDSENSIYKFVLKIGSNTEEFLEEYKPGEILETAPNEILEMLFNGEITADDLIETTGSVGVQVVDSKTNYIHFCNIFYKYFWFTALEDNCSIGFYHNPDSSIQPTLEYSFDRYEWNILSDNVSIPKDTNMYVRGMNPNGISGGYEEGNYNYFVGEGKFNVSGDIMTLINHKSIPKKMVGTFYNLFGGNVDTSRDNFVDIVDASNLILSAKILTSDCYHNMFDSCTSMVYGPQIKATTLAPFCCYKMFYDCTSLTVAPELPATTLETQCYAYMFSGCTSLTSAPELPATTLADNCYGFMFQGCTSLTSASELPATTLAPYCYQHMFNSCTSLTQAPELPATELATYCYYQMFQNCTSLITTPELPATTLAGDCYSEMFWSCTSLTTAPELPATTLADGCYHSMFWGCTSLTTAPELPATTLAPYCYQHMFLGCTNLTQASELPATTLAPGCYAHMFNGCTSLTTAPELPATTLSIYCYFAMFQGCSNLNYIKCLATYISGLDHTYNWVYEVASTGTFIKHPDTTWNTGSSGIPIGWTVENDIPYVTFTALEDNSSIGFYHNPDSSVNPTIEYSFDKNTWSTLTEDKISIPQNTNMYCRGINTDGISGGYGESGYNYFTGEGKFNVSGDIMTLIDYNTIPDTMVGTFYNLFGHNSDDFVDIVDASNLILSAKTLTSDCYQKMFDSCSSMVYGPQIKAEVLAPYCYHTMFFGCTSLETAPELPATELADNCYGSMFSSCTSLTTAPELPATTLAGSCYYGMFQGCTSLTTAPEILPATTLANGCYSYMFRGCTSLTTVPELPATELVYACYADMFQGCTSLTTAPELPAMTLADSCYSYMFCGCTSLTQAPEILPATTLATNCYQEMFRNCNSLITAPDLPATTLAPWCYSYMFYGCTSLTTAPDLPATTLAPWCYYDMFHGCASLNYIKCLATDISAYNCTYGWVYRVSSTGTFVKHPNMNDWTTGYSGIPSGWTVENYTE